MTISPLEKEISGSKIYVTETGLRFIKKRSSNSFVNPRNSKIRCPFTTEVSDVTLWDPDETGDFSIDVRFKPFQNSISNFFPRARVKAISKIVEIIVEQIEARWWANCDQMTIEPDRVCYEQTPRKAR